ncbi:MAG: hypothetical protein QE271_12670 [Bacteriovoracaceae bacterium]|nr:hypothetical protein [Bacteriovoracaceae bacterium]
MKTLLCLLFFSTSLSLFAQVVDPNVVSDLRRLKTSEEIGGAGNGGGALALAITRELNLTALNSGIDLVRLRSRYSLLVGNYNFEEGFSRAAHYYKNEHALLVNQSSWELLSTEEKNNLLLSLVQQIADE